MLTKNTFHLIVISDDYDPFDELESTQQQERSKYFGSILSFSILKISVKHFTTILVFMVPECDSKYCGFLASALCSPCLELTTIYLEHKVYCK